MASGVVLDPLYLHIRIVLSIILGLTLTTLLKGMVGFAQHPKRNKFSIIHFGWVLWSFISVVTFWWWEYRLADVREWTFGAYFFIITYCSSYFALAALLLPDDVGDYRGLEDYVLSRRFWIFGLIGAITLLDIGDTILKGPAHFAVLGSKYDFKIVITLIACLIGTSTTRRGIHIVLVTTLLAYQLWFALIEYFTITA